MLTVINKQAVAIDVFRHPVWIAPAWICPCPCCDIACSECGPKKDCPHSEHAEGSLCVFNSSCECMASFLGGQVDFCDCSCEEEQCEHNRALWEWHEARRPGQSRSAGGQRRAFIERREV